MRKQWQAAAAVAALTVGMQAQAQAQDRSVLPIPSEPFRGQIAENVTDSKPDVANQLSAPQGAPNIFLMMSDDVGFAMSSAFGGPVPTPNYDRIAAQGQRYSRFHTTGICSPSRAALLTGRNHHVAGTGYLTDSPTNYPSYQGRIPPETASIAQVLRLNGYNTAMFGKYHNVPPGEETANGPFDLWPTGIGFEYFLGYIGPESDQFRTNLFRGTNLLPNDDSMQLLDARLADDAISWLHNQQAPSRGKPFFIYFAPSSTHEPHQAPSEYIARFKGRFDQGWDQMRIDTWRRQLVMGIIPPGTKLTPRPEAIPAWNSLTPGQRSIAARSMEVAAAMLTYQDEQVGRVLSEMERMGVLDSTLVVLLLGDNGAAADQGLEGSFNRVMQTNQIPESIDWRLSRLDEMGGPKSYANYQAGWAWAMNTPLRWTKQYASMLGGIRNGMIMSWPGHVEKAGGVCAQFGHLVDIAPTILEAAELPSPESVLGVKQKQLDGRSLLPSLSRCDPAKPRTQYFEMSGKLGLWHNGWFASNDDGRTPWEGVAKASATLDTGWTLYNLDRDFSQSTDLSAKEPARLQDMITRWRGEAERNGVYPLDHSFGLGRKMQRFETPKHYTLWGKGVSMPAFRGPDVAGRSFTVDADLDLMSSQSSGVILALGSSFGGWSLFLDKGKPTFVYARSNEPDQITRIEAADALPAGKVKLQVSFAASAPGQPAEVSLRSESRTLATGRVPATIFMAGGSGEMLDTGRDTGVPVTDYATPHGEIEGEIRRIDIDLK